MSLSLQLILTCLLSLAAGFAGSFLARGSASLLDRKRLRELETEIASLTSEYSKVLALAKKISARVALDQHRQTSMSRSSTDGPPPGATKAELRDYYLKGKTPAQIARLHQGDN